MGQGRSKPQRNVGERPLTRPAPASQASTAKQASHCHFFQRQPVPSKPDDILKELDRIYAELCGGNKELGNEDLEPRGSGGMRVR